MMKKIALSAALLALLSTAAMGASIQMISDAASGGGNGYLVGALSSDGRYVGISHTVTLPDGRVFDGPALYDASTGTYLDVKLKSGHGGVRGVETMSDGTPVMICVEHSNADTASYRVGINAASGYLIDNKGGLGKPGSFNAMAMDSNGNGWMVGSGEKSATLQGQGWQITNGSVNGTAAWAKKIAGGKVSLNGMSVAGLAVGTDSKAGRGGTTDGPVIALVATGGTGWIIAPFGADTKGQGHGISNNGYWATGYFNDAATVDPLHGFRNDVRRNITQELFPVGFDPNEYQLSFGADAANNGHIVGYTYNAIKAGNILSGYRATIWYNGAPGQGYLLEEVLAGLGVDIHAAGFSYLERVIGISDDGTVVAGRAVRASDGAYVGFVATIPEPATLSFLALGGLPLLLRRRR